MTMTSLLRRGLATTRRRLDRHLLRAHDLLGRRLQLVVRLRQAAKTLHCGEHVRLLRRERITKLLQPGQIAVHGCQDDRERHQGFHARVPRLGFQCLRQRVAGQRLVCRVLHPARRGHDFKRERRGHQKLGQQVVGVERDRGDQRVELLRAERLACGRLSGDGRGRLGQHVEGECRVEHQATRHNPHEPASHMPSRNLDLGHCYTMKLLPATGRYNDDYDRAQGERVRLPRGHVPYVDARSAHWQSRKPRCLVPTGRIS